MPMKLYKVMLERVSYVPYTVEALDEGHAEEEAWKLLERDGEADNRDADWSLESVERYEP